MVLFCKHQPYMVLYGPCVLGTFFHPQILGVVGGTGWQGMEEGITGEY